MAAANHPRREILSAIKAQFSKVKDIRGAFIQRIEPNKNAWPAVIIYTDNEGIQPQEILSGARSQFRDLVIQVEGYIRADPDSESAELKLDELSALLEKTVVFPVVAGVQIDDFYLSAADFGVAEQDIGVHRVQLTYLCKYQTIEFLPA